MPKLRCAGCNTKLGLMKFTCKCSNNFCVNCLLPEKHNCTYNFKKEGKKVIEKNNPAIIQSKVPPI